MFLQTVAIASCIHFCHDQNGRRGAQSHQTCQELLTELQLWLFPGLEATNAAGSTGAFGYFICLFLKLTVNSKYVLRVGSVLSRTKYTLAKKISRKHNM